MRWTCLGFLVVAACGSSGPKLDDFLPVVPEPDGTPQKTFAGPITQASAQELIAGPAATGRAGDFFMRNERVRFVIEAPTRVIGIVPWGGNVVDATFTGAGAPGDELGEIGMVYYLGRTCAHETVEVLRDGAGGGPAVIRAIGKAAINDYINLNALGILSFPERLNPDVQDGVECATTYTLAPDTDTLEIAWTLYNPGPNVIKGPFGALDDTGGEIQVFSPGGGFQHLSEGFSALLSGSSFTVPYNTYQAPTVVYGLIPRVQGGVAGLVISGASVLLFGVSNFLDILDENKDVLNLAAQTGTTYRIDLVVGHQGADVEAAYLRGQPTGAVTGFARFMPSGTGARARVAVVRDQNDNGTIEDGIDYIVTTMDAAADGSFSGRLAPGTYLLRADVPDVARSVTQTVTVTANGTADLGTVPLAEPARYHYTVVDADSGQRIPARLTVVGQTPVPLSKAATETYERYPGVVRILFAVHGTSLPPGTDPGDAPLDLPAGGPYRLLVSHGPEWTIATVDIPSATAGQQTTLPNIELMRVVDTSGYVATAFHEHSEGSPDSPTGFADRVRSLVVEGVELFASTDHDRISEYTPVIASLGLAGVIGFVPGIEATPFAYGHFNAYPIAVDASDPSGGAPDWGLGPQGLSLLPEQIWNDLRGKGAEVVQVCHPRSVAFGSTFQGYFGRAGLAFDFTARTAAGVASKQDFPNEVLRLPPGVSLFSDSFDALETWNGFGTADTDGDGVAEYDGLDRVLRDWMSFLSLGKIFTPVGNGDTHTRDRDAAGLPRTLVRVPDDSAEAIAAGVADEVWRTLKGTALRDVVVTNGPFLQVTQSGNPSSAIGRTLTVASGEPVALDVVVSAPDWIDFDTVEVFANDTFDELRSGAPSSLTPLLCFTSRTGLAAADPCGHAQGGPRALAVTVAAGLRQATVSISLAAADVETRAGKTGDDAWLVVRARGRRAVYPVVLGGAITAQNLATLTTGDPAAVAAALDGRGAPAMAFTAPIFVDFDGGGWRAPFAP